MVTGSSKAAYYYCGEAIPQPATTYCCPETSKHATAPPTTRQGYTASTLNDTLPPGVVYYDPYQVLHLRRDATSDEITTAYRRFALLRHPSRCASPNSTHGSAITASSPWQFAAVAAAYETLSAMETRQRMDLILNGQTSKQSRISNEEDLHECCDTKTANQVIKSRAPDRTQQELEFRKQLQSQRRQALRHRKEAKRLAKKKRRGIRGMVTTAVENRRKGKSATRSHASASTKGLKRKAKRELTVLTPMHQRAPVSSVSESVDEHDVAGSIEDGESSFSTDDDTTNSALENSQQAEATDTSNVGKSGFPRNIYTSTAAPTPTPSTGSCLQPLQVYTGCLPAEGDQDSDDETTIVFSKSNGTTSSVSRTTNSFHTSGSKATKKSNQAKAKAKRVALFPRALPALVQSSTTCSTTREDVQHYSSTTTEHLFGGPLQLMYQARRWQPFTDPHVVFERVFGSVLLGNRDVISKPDDRSSVLTMATHPDTAAAVVASTSPSAWAGTTDTLADGTVVNVKSRVIQDAQGQRRLMKRTVTRLPADATSGLCRTTITVTSVDLKEQPEAVAPKHKTTTPCPPEICANDGTDAHTTKSMLSKAGTRDKLDDAGTAATADDDWSLASLCQSWLSPCCG